MEYDPGEEEGLSLHQKHRLFVDRMEMELTGLEPMDEKKLKAMTGRNEGPRFCSEVCYGERHSRTPKDDSCIESLETDGGLARRPPKIR